PVHAYHAHALDRRALVPHLARHPHAPEHPGGVGGADGTRPADVHRPMALGPPAEAMALDQALEALPLRGRAGVDHLAFTEAVALQLLAHLQPVEVADLDH